MPENWIDQHVGDESRPSAGFEDALRTAGFPQALDTALDAGDRAEAGAQRIEHGDAEQDEQRHCDQDLEQRHACAAVHGCLPITSSG